MDNDEPPPPHTSVLLREVVDALEPRSGVGYRALDCTLGAGGHAYVLLEQSAPDGTLVGLDADPRAIAVARTRLAQFGQRVTLVQTNFGAMAELELEPMN